MVSSLCRPESSTAAELGLPVTYEPRAILLLQVIEILVGEYPAALIGVRTLEPETATLSLLSREIRQSLSVI